MVSPQHGQRGRRRLSLMIITIGEKSHLRHPLFLGLLPCIKCTAFCQKTCAGKAHFFVAEAVVMRNV